MSSVILCCTWIIAAKAVAIFPTRDSHWRAAYILMTIGAPILAWTVWQHGFLAGLAALLAGAWVLRWPVYFLWKRVRRVFAGD